MAPIPQANFDSDTRSAFVPITGPEVPAQYTRLLEFSTPNCGAQFFIRFKLHCVPGQHPALAFCNAAGNIFFWDFKRLTAYRDFVEKMNDPDRDRSVPLRPPPWLKPIVHRNRADGQNKRRQALLNRSVNPSTQGSQTDSRNGSQPSEGAAAFTAETLESWAGKYSMEDPHEPLRAHRTENSMKNFVGRQAAWSPGGEWCVIVGSSNFALISQRWAKKTAPKRSEPARSNSEAEKLD